MKANIFLLLSLMIMSCSSRSGNDVLEIDTIRMNKNVVKVVEQYIDANPGYSSYIINANIESKEYLEGGMLFTISHYDSSLFGNGEWSVFPLHPSICFKVKGKTVYVISNMDYMLSYVSQKRYDEGRNIDAACRHYYKDAVMYYVGRDKDVRLETLRPDTVLLKKRVHFEVPPIK